MLALLAAGAAGQFRGFQAAVALPPAPVRAKPGETFEAPVTIRVRPGYHINSDKPNEDYLIPTRLVWDAAGFEVVSIEYPRPETVRYDFSDKPLSVFSGEFQIRTLFRAPAKLAPGEKTIPGRLRYQACNNKACLAPATLEVKAVIR